MPGPFPGMDPYLESPGYWRDLHHRFITYVSEALNAVLPPQYAATIDVRLYVVQPDRSIDPDLAVLETAPRPPDGESGGRAGLAVAADPAWRVKVYPAEIREGYVEIIRASDSESVITTIELLSPTNKAPGSEGRRQYQQKQRDVLAGQTHLIEIDLLRQDAHTVAVPLDTLLERGQWDYLVSLSRSDDRTEFDVWAIPLRQRLPRIRVPLAAPDPDLALDLQPVLDRCYDLGRYANRIAYRGEPPLPPLSKGNAEWLEAVLRSQGLRPANGQPAGEEEGTP